MRGYISHSIFGLDFKQAHPRLVFKILSEVLLPSENPLIPSSSLLKPSCPTHDFCDRNARSIYLFFSEADEIKTEVSRKECNTRTTKTKHQIRLDFGRVYWLDVREKKKHCLNDVNWGFDCSFFFSDYGVEDIIIFFDGINWRIQTWRIKKNLYSGCLVLLLKGSQSFLRCTKQRVDRRLSRETLTSGWLLNHMLCWWRAAGIWFVLIGWTGWYFLHLLDFPFFITEYRAEFLLVEHEHDYEQEQEQARAA